MHRCMRLDAVCLLSNRQYLPMLKVQNNKWGNKSQITDHKDLVLTVTVEMC